MAQALVFLTGFIAFYAAHLASDYPLQTDSQAQHKDKKSVQGWLHNQLHAGTHTVVSLITLLLVPALALGLPLSVLGTASALAWIHVSHAFIDRRWPISWWMQNTRQTGFQAHGDAAHVDQAAHVVLGLLPAALLLAKLG